MGDNRADIEYNAKWLRTIRDHVGWSTGDVARAIRAVAEELEDRVQLSQQTVSAFENGQHKSNPRWLGYAQIAAAKEIRRRELSEENLWKLKSPKGSRSFFFSQRKRAGVLSPQDEFLGPPGKVADRLADDQLTSEERGLLDLFRELTDAQRKLVTQVVKALVDCGKPPTLHAPKLEYKSG